MSGVLQSVFFSGSLRDHIFSRLMAHVFWFQSLLFHIHSSCHETVDSYRKI